ncbi:hypothetical protein CAOG_009327 [Capsaspora owczarzaki ATCC 30864]|uniref:Uncharacterized protein n=1 Tax=Capsaspora owczarzaki (strain ATCC 30864) TaxID=595528 RepID=A0A0D2WHP9_CAPO3|nr:hypothetical protein CAOG_009327 [Capsaspora owczarzaki ATCC 30864]
MASTTERAVVDTPAPAANRLTIEEASSSHVMHPIRLSILICGTSSASSEAGTGSVQPPSPATSITA